MIYDLVIIGLGPAGYTAGVRAIKQGLKVAVVERDRAGGTCLNRGCIPMKTLLHSAKVYDERLSFDELGITGDIAFDSSKVYLRKNEISQKLSSGVESLLKGADVFKCDAEVFDGYVMADGQKIEYKNLVIATGSKPFMPKIEGIKKALNSDDVFAAEPEGDRLVIIGGGVIGMEFATYFSYTGKTVTVVEGTDRVLPMFSKEISTQIASLLRQKGVTFKTGVTATKIGDGFVELSGGERIECDNAICAVGRAACLDGLESLNLELERGYIKVDNNFQTNVKQVYAIGDVTGKCQLAHYAFAEGVNVVDVILGNRQSVDLSVVPSCVYTYPQIASVGKTEGESVSKFMTGGNAKSIIEGYSRGFVKLYADGKVIVGAELFCDNATELISELAVAIANKLKIEDVAKVIHPHPTVSESVSEAVWDFTGLATHKR